MKNGVYGNWKPIRVPTDVIVPKVAPDAVVEADHEKIKLAGSARQDSNALIQVIKYGLAGQRKPVMVPTGVVVPEGGPHVVVVADDEQVEVAGGAGEGSEALMLTIEYGLSG